MDWLEIVFLILLLIGQAAMWYSAGYNRGSAAAVTKLVDVFNEMLEKV